MRSQLHELPRIPNFAEAERIYNTIKPIRGTTVRPLGNRRAKHYAIEKISDTKYVCTLYGHHVITYTKETVPGEGTLVGVSLCGYNTQTTRGFIGRITSLDCYSRNRITYIEVGKRATEDPETGKYKVTGAYYLPPNYTLQIRYARVLNPVPVQKKVLDRAVTKELRNKYKGEMQTAEAMLRMGVAKRSDEYNPHERAYHLRGEFLDDLTSDEVSEYLWLLASIWQRVYPTPSLTHRSYILHALYKIAALDAITIYKEVELPIGQRA